MSQVGDYDVANASGASVRSDLNFILGAIKTCNSGSSNPSNPEAFMFYGDTNDNTLKIRGSGSTFTLIGSIDQANLGLLPRSGGTTAPMTGQFLADSGGTASAPAIAFGDGSNSANNDTDTGLYRSAANTLAISCAGSNRFNFNTTEFQSKSDISIEKTGSDAFLQINADSSYNAYLDFSTDTTTAGSDFGLRLIRGAGATGDSILMHRSSDSNNGSLLIQNQNPTQGNIAFSTGGDATTTPEAAPIERWKIEHSGSLTSNGSLATNALTTAGACFNIQTTAFEGLSLVKNNTGWGTALFINRLTGAGTGNFVELQYNNSNVGAISTNGSSTTYATASDYRLKENIVDLVDGITRLKTLKPYRFNFISDTNTTVDGFLAHEVTAVPEAITGTKDEVEPEDNDMRGVKKGDPVYQSIDQSKIVPLLVAALQEAIAKIETLEAKVAALEAS